ncbi:MAG: STT3 domain-containing protein [Sulfolobales archaeon]
MSKSSGKKVKEHKAKVGLLRVATNRKFVLVLGLALLVFSVTYGVHLRMRIVQNSIEHGYGPTLYELDPFQEYFVASVLLEHGLDYVTYLNHYNNLTHLFWYPWGRDFTHSVYIGLPIFSIGTYHLVRLFNPGMTLYEWMVYLPPLFFVISVVGIYLAVRELSSDLPAGIASLSYSLMFNSRQLAGFTVKYSIGLAFLSIAIFFHIRAWKRRDYFSASLAGLMLGLAALGWAGYNVVFVAMVAHVVLLPFVRQLSIKDLVLWVIEYAPLFILQVIAPTYGIRYVVRSVGVLGPASILLLVLGYLIHRVGVSRFSTYLGILAERPKLTYFAVLAIAGLLGIYVIVGGKLALAGKALAAVGLGTLTHVLVETVAEYQPAGAQDVIVGLGAAIVYATISTIYMFLSSLVKKRDSKYGWYILLLALILIVAALIYGRQELPLSQFVVSAAIAAGLLGAALGSGLKDEYFFLVALFAFSIVGTINISYFSYLLAIAASILVGYIVYVLISSSVSRRSGLLTKLISAVIVCVYIVSVVFQGATMWVRAYNAQLPTIVEASLGLNVEAPVWVDGLKWVKENTPADSVIVSWWDYGYWISVIGRRPSVADGATINATHIEILANALTSTEETALDIFVKQFRIRPERLYVAVYEVFVVDVSTNLFYPGPLVFGNTILGADAAKGIAAIYKIANKTPPVYVYRDPNAGIAVGLPDWVSENLTSTLLYKVLIDAAYQVWGPNGYRAAFIYRNPQYPPEIPRPAMSFFEPAYISTSLLFTQGSYSAYVLLAIYKPRTAT